MVSSNSDNGSLGDDDSGCAISRQHFVIKKISSISSFESFEQDPYLSDTALSDDLDKLSLCLTEVSDEEERKKPGIVRDLIQAELAFWTLVFSFLYSYAWLQHRKKFILSIFVAIPMVLMVCITIAFLLGAIVVMSRLFSTTLKIEKMLKFGQVTGEEVSRRRRSLSNASRRSSISYSGRSSLCEEFPKPVCRKHSTSNNSLNQIHISINGNNNGAGSPISGRRTPTSPTIRKMSYTFAHHQSANEEFFD